MAKKQTAESVYRVVDVVGVSDKSWEDAGRRAVRWRLDSSGSLATFAAIRHALVRTQAFPAVK